MTIIYIFSRKIYDVTGFSFATSPTKTLKRSCADHINLLFTKSWKLFYFKNNITFKKIIILLYIITNSIFSFLGLQVVRGKKGSLNIIYDGYSFCRNGQSGPRIWWRCTGYEKSKCDCRITTENFQLVGSQKIRKRRIHNHPKPELSELVLLPMLPLNPWVCDF